MLIFLPFFLKKNLALIPREHVATDLYQSLYDTSIVPVLTPRIHFRDAHENNQTTIFFLVLATSKLSIRKQQ